MRRCIAIIGALLLLGSAALAQEWSPPAHRLVGMLGPRTASNGPADDFGLAVNPPAFNLTVPVPRVRMSPDLALTAYLGLAKRQLAELGAYSDNTVIEADLPDNRQHGKFELRRTYQAPRSLAFAAIRFTGDNFVKTNIIARLLQSEVDHAQKGEGAQTAITADNYKFSFKGTETTPEGVAYLYNVKPRHKRPGLFKGRIVVDAASGRLLRAEGTMVKSPSFFVKKIEFVQNYAEYGPFSMPVRLHSVARTRLVGRAVVDIVHSDYQAMTMSELLAVGSGSGTTGTASSDN